MLHEFMTEHREEILRRSVRKVATPPSAADVIDHGVFLDQLCDALRTGLSTPRFARVRFQHRIPLPGLALSHVIWQDYFDVRDAISELALIMNAPITVDEFRRLDECVDSAIVQAMAESHNATNEHC
jgi:hypothetical protein